MRSLPAMSPARLASIVLIALGAAMLPGCQEPDVGQSCSFDISTPDGVVVADYLETGKTECENLVCIRSPAVEGWTRPNPYCSKPCVSDDDCSRSETGLSCRSVVLDPEFIASLPQDVRDKYLGDLQFSSYCAIPRD
jgi:hypothetical protein